MYVMQKGNFRLSAVAIALMSVFGTVLADDAEIAELIKPDSSISVGIGNWSNERHQQGIYDGMRDNGAYGLFDADIVKRDDATGTWYKLKATNLGLDNREVKGEYLRQGNVGVTVEYNRLSRDNPNDYNTRLQGSGTTTQTVSTNAIPGPLHTLQLGTTREGVGLGLYKNLAPGLDFNLTFKNEEKNGTRAWGRGGAAEFAVEPIDSTTRQLEGTLSYSTKTWQLSGGYYGSWYENNKSLVRVTNAGLAINNSNTTYLSLPLDNQAHQLFLNAGYTFTPTTRATLKMSYTRLTQDEHLPTQDIVSVTATPFSKPGSPQNLQGEINTTLVQLGLTSRPIKDLSLVANLRYHDSKDETPVNRYVQRVVGGVLQACGTGNAQCVDNTPFSYKTITGKFEGTYRLAEGYNLTAGVEERQQDRRVPVSNAIGAGGTDNQRVVPMRSSVDETTWRLELRRSLSEVLNGSLAYLYSERTGSNYLLVGGPGNSTTNGIPSPGPSNMINPLNIADRDRSKVRLAIDWTPIENLSFQFNVEEGRDKYAHSNERPYGIQEGTNRLYAFDASYTLSDKWKFNAWYSFDQSEAKQANSRANNSPTNPPPANAVLRKDYDLKDTGNSVGLGVRGEVTSRIKLGGDLQWSRNVSRYDQSLTVLVPGVTAIAGFTPGLADIENKLTRLSLFSTYSLDKSSDVRVDFIHERWETNDWSWMFANGTPFTYGTTTDGTTVTSNPRQTSSFVGLRYIYKFQ